MSLHLNNWVMLGAAFVGIVSAAGIMIAEYHKQERKKHSMSTDLARLDQQVAMLKMQLEKLQKSQKTSAEAKTRRKPRDALKPYTSSTYSTVSDDYSSTRELDSSDLEFYDLSDEETSKASTITPLDTVLKEIDERLDTGDPSQLSSVLQTLESLCYEYPESTDLLWRMGRTYHKLASDPEKAEYKMEYLNKGLEVCEQAINLDGDCFEANKWYVLLIGSLMPLKPIRERAKDSILFKKLLDKALEICPTDITLLHSLGRYHYEICSLKWYEKKIVNALCGESVEVSYEQGLDLLLKADELSPTPWRENKLCVAKCYINLSNYTDALKWLDEAKEMAPLNLANAVDAEIENLLMKYDSYRTK